MKGKEPRQTRLDERVLAIVDGCHSLAKLCEQAAHPGPHSVELRMILEFLCYLNHHARDLRPEIVRGGASVGRVCVLEREYNSAFPRDIVAWLNSAYPGQLSLLVEQFLPLMLEQSPVEQARPGWSCEEGVRGCNEVWDEVKESWETLRPMPSPVSPTESIASCGLNHRHTFTAPVELDLAEMLHVYICLRACAIDENLEANLPIPRHTMLERVLESYHVASLALGGISPRPILERTSGTGDPRTNTHCLKWCMDNHRRYRAQLSVEYGKELSTFEHQEQVNTHCNLLGSGHWGEDAFLEIFEEVFGEPSQVFPALDSGELPKAFANSTSARGWTDVPYSFIEALGGQGTDLEARDTHVFSDRRVFPGLLLLSLQPTQHHEDEGDGRFFARTVFSYIWGMEVSDAWKRALHRFLLAMLIDTLVDFTKPTKHRPYTLLHHAFDSQLLRIILYAQQYLANQRRVPFYTRFCERVYPRTSGQDSTRSMQRSSYQSRPRERRLLRACARAFDALGGRERVGGRQSAFRFQAFLELDPSPKHGTHDLFEQALAFWLCEQNKTLVSSDSEKGHHS